MRRVYSVHERQFKTLLRDGRAPPGVTGENLLRLLETRLDNVVFRMGFATSRAQARQLVDHGHFAVNGRATDVPSYRRQRGRPDRGPRGEPQVRATSRTQGDPAERPATDWLTVDADKLAGNVTTLPRRDQMPRRAQRAARGRVLLEVGRRPMIELGERADRAGRGARRHVRQVRGQPAARRLRRHHRQRPAPRAAVARSRAPP